MDLVDLQRGKNDRGQADQKVLYLVNENQVITKKIRLVFRKKMRLLMIITREKSKMKNIPAPIRTTTL